MSAVVSPSQGEVTPTDSHFHRAKRHSLAISPRVFARVLSGRSALCKQRARGMPGARSARRRMCSGGREWSAHALVRSHRNRPAFPTRCFTAYGVLASAVAFSTVAGRSLHRLEASIGCIGTTRFCRPPQVPPSEAPSTATATRPALLTLRNAPRSGTGWERYSGDLGILKIRIFLHRGLDTPNLIAQVICPSGIVTHVHSGNPNHFQPGTSLPPRNSARHVRASRPPERRRLRRRPTC